MRHGVQVGQKALDAGLDLLHIRVKGVANDRAFEPLPEALGGIQVRRIGREVPHPEPVVVLLPKGLEALGVMDLRVVADQHEAFLGVFREQSLHKPLEGLRREVRRLLNRHGAAPDVDGPQEGDARVVAIGGHLVLVAAEEPGRPDGLVRADVALILEQDQRVGRGVFFSVSSSSRKAACSAGRARFNT